jgi:hypothetical protein
VDILVTGATVVTMDAARGVIEAGAVAIRGDRIVAVGKAADLNQQYRAEREISAPGKLVLPGLINTHNHAAMVLFRGIADDLALMEWLQKFIFPAEARNVTADFVEAGTALAVVGNHDDKLKRHLAGRSVKVSHGLAETIEQFAAEPPEFATEMRAWLDGLISHYVLDGGKLVVAHAGLKEEMQGRASGAVRSFWALRHPAAKPDFHDPACFTAELAPPRAS